MINLKVMTYNVQWFTKINSQLSMQKEIFDRNEAQIIGLQELSTDGKVNRVGKAALAGYPILCLSDHKNYLGIASQYVLKNIRSHDFKHQDPEDMARHGETRAYITARLEIGGKTVTLINTHLCYLTPDVKYQQMKEIFDVAMRHKCVIITGDFNCFGEYEQMYRQFVAAGFRLADCDAKVTKTWTEKPNPKYLGQFTYPTDNIIVSPNIRIKKVRYDKTKLKYPDGNPMDHIPIVATLQIR